MSLEDDINRVAVELDHYAKKLDHEATRYWDFHHERFRYITRLTGELIGKMERSDCSVEKILDVGNSFQTLMINRVRPDLAVDTMGFMDERYRPAGITKHYAFDLNDTYYPDRLIVLEEKEKYDIILFLEVIEHLYTAPEQVLSFLGSLLKPHGFIVIQTPNAAALISRVRLLFGRNPYDPIRKNRMNPGHFREYTKLEIADLAKQSGFSINDLIMMDYFRPTTTAETICQRVAKLLPVTFRTGMTVILRKMA
jgi:2-polyprenyl-3-methyl-5-hydroxy-6-metoxy-1,4-benzoquinol methylase